MAPKTIHRMDAAMTPPSSAAAATCRGGTCQTVRLTSAVTSSASGMALEAGQRNATSSTRTASRGVRAARITATEAHAALAAAEASRFSVWATIRVAATKLSGLSEIESMPCSTRKPANSG